MVSMIAKFAGYCVTCGKPIVLGTLIDYDTQTKKAQHTQCPKESQRYFTASYSTNTSCLKPNVGDVIEHDGAQWRVVEAHAIGVEGGRGRYGTVYCYTKFQFLVEPIEAVLNEEKSSKTQGKRAV